MARAIVLAILLASAGASVLEENSGANPIRKVVGLLQGLAKKIEEEGDKAVKLHDDNECYCKKAKADITATISEDRAKIPELESGIEETAPKIANLKQELKTQQEDQVAAKDAVAAAQKQRDTEHAAYVKETDSSKDLISVVAKAIKGIESGKPAFIQESGLRTRLQSAFENSLVLSEGQRQQILGFLSGGDTAPGSSEIAGMLKTMKESSETGLSDTEAEEEKAATNHKQLVAAKTEQANSLHEPIREKTERIAALAISLVNFKKDLAEVKSGLDANELFEADLMKTCGANDANFEKNSKARNEEKVAIQATIKILNDDDSLETFKKTLPGASLLQVDARRSKALRILRDAKRSSDTELLLLALKGGKADFTKVSKMVDNMVKLLDQEQSNDDTTLENCKNQIAASKAQLKDFNSKIKYAEASVADQEENLAAATEEINTITSGIQQLDASVSEAGKQRKEEHAEFVELTSSNHGAVELLKKAKARMGQFYDSPEFVQTTSSSLVQISSHTQLSEEQPYEQKTAGANKILAMLDRLIAGLKNEVLVAEEEEKDSQADYEKMIADAEERRSGNAKALVEKEAVKADTESAILEVQRSLKSHEAQKVDGGKYASSMHAQCDWLMSNFEDRKTARATERQSLIDTKATLAGADLALVQTKALRGSM